MSLVGADHLLPSMQARHADPPTKAFDADERVIAPLAAGAAKRR